MRKPPVSAEVIAGLIALVEPEFAGAVLGSWTALGKCTAADPEIFFPAKGDPGETARAVCAGCEVRVQCLAYATVNADDICGIWGGLNRPERIRLRDAVRARRSSGRPTGTDAA